MVEAFPIEPFSILNPGGRGYRFLFNEVYDEENTKRAVDYISGWALDHGWSIQKQRQHAIPKHGWFEIAVWLK